MRSQPTPNSSPDPDAANLQALRAGERAGLDRLMERHEAGIFHFFRNALNDREDARDLAQDVFVRAYLACAQFDGKGSVKAWLYRIAVNLLRDRIKSKAHRQRAKTGSLDAAPAGGAEPGSSTTPPALVSHRTPVEASMGREDLATLRAAISRLPEELRPAFVLAVVQERPYRECAELLGLSVKAVEMRVYKARKQLQEELRGRWAGS